MVLKRVESWVNAAESVSGSWTSLLPLLRSISGLVADKAWERWCCVSLRVVPAWPMGTSTNSTFPLFFEGDDEWGVLSGLFLKPLVASAVLVESDFD